MIGKHLAEYLWDEAERKSFKYCATRRRPELDHIRYFAVDGKTRLVVRREECEYKTWKAMIAQLRDKADALKSELHRMKSAQEILERLPADKTSRGAITMKNRLKRPRELLSADIDKHRAMRKEILHKVEQIETAVVIYRERPNGEWPTHRVDLTELSEDESDDDGSEDDE